MYWDLSGKMAGPRSRDDSLPIRRRADAPQILEAVMVRYLLRGTSAWGVQWEKKDDEREIARRVLNLLADRRMLRRDYSLEIEEHCVQSALDARRQLSALLGSPRSVTN